MLQILETFLGRLNAYLHRRGIERAIALNLRGEVRRHGLTDLRIVNHLEVDWRARGIHPWDHELIPPSGRGAAFVTQALADTEAAISRLFASLPDLDVITLKVFDHASDEVIMSGSVLRSSIAARNEMLSVGMRLINLGIMFHSDGSLFEAVGGTSLRPDFRN